MTDAPVINGWSIITHPLFTSQIDVLQKQVETLCIKDPDNYKKKKAYKLLKAILKIAYESIPQDPTRAEFRQGDTLGKKHKHWFRRLVMKIRIQSNWFRRLVMKIEAQILDW